jgi:hypothetical protein
VIRRASPYAFDRLVGSEQLKVWLDPGRCETCVEAGGLPLGERPERCGELVGDVVANHAERCGVRATEEEARCVRTVRYVDAEETTS